ncbi:hypothetical protein AURDEDRAFT_166601 [Auricularia subglabra TFB-10046 SS5]|nr:hypothetical protein AURDEDRAFT_166601 [Auricularia subglabra TFB-10046 SS5]
MFAPRAVVLALVALAGAVAAAPQSLPPRTCTAPNWPQPYTCPGACCVCDGGLPGCLADKCYCLV